MVSIQMLLTVAGCCISALASVLLAMLWHWSKGQERRIHDLESKINAHEVRLATAETKTASDDERFEKICKDMSDLKETLGQLVIKVTEIATALQHAQSNVHQIRK